MFNLTEKCHHFNFKTTVKTQRIKYKMAIKNNLLMITVISILSTLFITCTIDELEPIPGSPDYPVDGYHFELQIDSLPDTLYTFKPYTISWRDIGKDQHWSFWIHYNGDDILDTINHHFPTVNTDDSLMYLYFFKEYSDSITFEGIRWNYKPSHDSSFFVHVENRFMISYDKFSVTKNNPVEFTIDTKEDSPVDSLLYVLWYVNDEKMDSTKLTDTFTYNPGNSDYFTLKAEIGDTTKHLAIPDSIQIILKQPKPSIAFASNKISVPIDVPYNLTATVKDADTIFWESKNLAFKRSTTTPQITLTWTDEKIDTVIAYVKAWNDSISNPDTVIIEPLDYKYLLQPVNKTFSDTIRARQWAAFAVGVTSAGASIEGDSVTYTWKITPENSYDSLKTNSAGDSVVVYFQNTVDNPTISVKAQVGEDSTNEITKSFIIREFRPTVTMVTEPFEVFTKSDISIEIKAQDSNVDGSIAEIFYQLSGIDTAISVQTNTQWSVQFTTAGEKTIKVWAIDNDGFVSDTVSVTGTVVSTKPSFETTTIDTTIFINQTISITASAIPGADNSPISTYQWDIDSDGTVDFDTTAKIFNTLFTSPGTYTIRVHCKNEKGEQSETPLEVTINVTAGEPVIELVKPDTVWVVDDTAYTIRANDINGDVEKYYVDWNNTGEFTEFTDSLVNHSFIDTGMHVFNVYVADNDGVSSDTITDSVFVLEGKPSFISMSIDTPMQHLYIKDEREFVFKGSDINDYVDSIFVSWDGDEEFENKIAASGDSGTITYAFEQVDSGEQQIRIRIQDPDGIFVDSLYSITVMSGAPIIDSISPNTDDIWVVDTNTYTIFAHDLNGNIDSFEVDWQSTGTWEGSKTSIFSHSYDTSQSGIQSVRVRVMDEDSVWSVADLPITVKLGRPVISGASFGDTIQWVEGENGGLDTMFYVYKGIKTTMAVDTSDSNGQCGEFYWDLDKDGINETNSTPFYTTDLQKNVLRELKVWCKDNDGISSEPLYCWVYPDSPPDTPIVYADPISITDSVTIYWRGKDFKDKNETEYTVLLRANSNPDSSKNEDIISSWSSSYEPSSLGAYDFMYRFPLTPSGGLITYNFRVIARDKRLSITQSVIDNFPY